MEGKPGIRVIEDQDISAPYVYLSHSWGEDHMAILTKLGTLPSNLEFIAWDMLPRSFRNDITISRLLLGMRV